MSSRLKNKVAIVTGAGQGIGKAIALAFAREGAAVVIADCNTQTAAATTDEIEQNGGRALCITTDVTVQASMQTCADTTVAEFGRIDILAANAGVNVFHEPLETTGDEWRRCFAVNLDGMWNSARAVLPQMTVQRKGAIVFMASCHGFQAIPNCFPYGVSKHAVVGLIRALAVQYGPQGIRVNGIAPSYVETEAAKQYWDAFPDPEAERQRARDLHPFHHIGQPDEVAMAAVFLASDEAPFINAAIIPMDGGRSAMYHE